MNEKDVKLTCACCYCGTAQDIPTPPALVDCTHCKRPFRVLWNHGQKSVMELTPEARKHYAETGVA